MGPTDENRSLPPSASPYDDRASLSRLQTAEAARLRPRASLSLIPQAGARSRISLKPRPTKPLVSPRPHVKLGQSTTVRPAVEVELPTSEPSAAPSSALASSSPDRSHLSLDHALGLGTMNPVASTSTHTLDPPHTIKRQVGSSLSESTRIPRHAPHVLARARALSPQVNSTGSIKLSPPKTTSRRTTTARALTPRPTKPTRTPRAVTPARLPPAPASAAASATPRTAGGRSHKSLGLASPARSPTETLLEPITINSDEEDPLLLHGGEAMRGVGEGNPLLELEFTEARRSMSVELSARRSGGYRTGGGTGRRGSREPVGSWGKRPQQPSGLAVVLRSGRENSLEGEAKVEGVAEASDSDDGADASFAREDDTFAFATYPALAQSRLSVEYAPLGNSILPVSDFASRTLLDESTSTRGADHSLECSQPHTGLDQDDARPLHDGNGDFGGEEHGDIYVYPSLRGNDSSEPEPSDAEPQLEPRPRPEPELELEPIYEPATNLNQSLGRGRFRIERIHLEQDSDLDSTPSSSFSPASHHQSPAPHGFTHDDSDERSDEDGEPTLLIRAAPTPKPELRHAKKRRMTDEVPRRLTGDFVIPIEPPTSSPSRSPEHERQPSPWSSQRVKYEAEEDDGTSMSLETSSPGEKIFSKCLSEAEQEERDEDEVEAVKCLPRVTIEQLAEAELLEADADTQVYELPFPHLATRSPSPLPSPTRLSSSALHNSLQPFARSTSPAEPLPSPPTAKATATAQPAPVRSPLPRPRRLIVPFDTDTAPVGNTTITPALANGAVMATLDTPGRPGPAVGRMLLSPLPQSSPRATMALGKRAGRTSIPAPSSLSSSSISTVIAHERPMAHQARLTVLRRKMRSMSPGVSEVEAMLTPRKRVTPAVEAVAEEEEAEVQAQFVHEPVEPHPPATADSQREASAELVPKVEDDVDLPVPISTTPIIIDSPAPSRALTRSPARTASPFKQDSPTRSHSPIQFGGHTPVQLASPAHTSPEPEQEEQQQEFGSPSVEVPMELDGPSFAVFEEDDQGEEADAIAEVAAEDEAATEVESDGEGAEAGPGCHLFERPAPPELNTGDDEGGCLRSSSAGPVDEVVVFSNLQSDQHEHKLALAAEDGPAAEDDATDEDKVDEQAPEQDNATERQSDDGDVPDHDRTMIPTSLRLDSPEPVEQRSSPGSVGKRASESDATEDEDDAHVNRYSPAGTLRVPPSVERMRASGNVSLGRAALQGLLFGQPAHVLAADSVAVGKQLAPRSAALESTPRASVVTWTGQRQRGSITPRLIHPSVPVIEISSTSPRAAAKAAAILKVYGDYVEQGLQPPGTLLRAAGLHSSYRGDQRLRGLLKTAEKEIRRSTHSPAPLSQPVFAARAGQTPSPTSSRAAEPGSAGGRNDFPPTSPAQGSVASAQVEGHWGTADWRQLEKCLVKAGRRARHDGTELSEETVVERYLLEVGYQAGNEGEGDWAFDKLLTRVRALQARRLRGSVSRASSVAVPPRPAGQVIKPEPLSDEEHHRRPPAREDAPISDTAELPMAEDDTFFHRQPEAHQPAALVDSSSSDEDDDDADAFRRERQPSVPLALAGARFAHLFEDEPMEKPPLPAWAQEELRQKREAAGRGATPEPRGQAGLEPVSSARKLMNWVGGWVGRGTREAAPGPSSPVVGWQGREGQETENEQDEDTSSEIEMLEVPRRERSASSSLSHVIAVASYSSSSSSSAHSSSPPLNLAHLNDTQLFPEPTFYRNSGAAGAVHAQRPPPPSPRALPNLVQDRIRELEEAESSREEESRVIEQLMSGVKRKASVELAAAGRERSAGWR